MMYSPSSMTARNPNLLGQPCSKNTRFSARHSPLTTLDESRQAPGWNSLAALAQKAQSAFKHVIQLHLGASGAVKYAEQVEFEPKWADSIPLIFGAWLEASINTTDKITRKKMIPVIETSINLLLPYLSTKHMLTMEPTAFRPEVMRESANATEFEANPANCTMVGA